MMAIVLLAITVAVEIWQFHFPRPAARPSAIAEGERV
jgi:hypothetical protein